MKAILAWVSLQKKSELDALDPLELFGLHHEDGSAL